MNEEVLQLIIQVNADITLSDTAKVELTETLEKCASEEEFLAIKASLEKYWANVDPIIQGALARKTPEELGDIENVVARMAQGSQNIVESSIKDDEKNEANNLITEIF